MENKKLYKQPKYKLMQEVAFKDRDGLNAGKIVGINWSKASKDFTYEIETYDDEYPYYGEAEVFPLNSYIVVNIETGLTEIIEKE